MKINIINHLKIIQYKVSDHFAFVSHNLLEEKKYNKNKFFIFSYIKTALIVINTMDEYI